MSARTFTRKSRASVESPSSTSKKSRRQKQTDPFDLLAEPEDCSDPLSPFFFGDSDQEAPAQAPPAARHSPRNGSGRAKAVPSASRNHSGKAGSSGSGRAQAGLAVPLRTAAGRESGRSTQQQRGQQPVLAPKPRQPAVPTPPAALLPSPARGRNSRAPKQHPEEKEQEGIQALTAPRASQQQARQPSGEAAEPEAAAAAQRGRPSAGGKRPSIAAGPAAAAAGAQLERQLSDGGPAKPSGPSHGKRGPGSGAAPKTGSTSRPPPPSKRMKQAAGGSGGMGSPATDGASDEPAPVAAPTERASGRAAAPAAVPGPARGPSVAGLQLAALSRLLHPAALREQAAATTVVQAQALGEQQSITDDALWALDGLASGSAATCRDSLAALAEICAARRGRLALRSGNLAADVLGAAGALKVQEDPVQALGLATLLLCFCQADADAALLGRREVAGGAAALLRLSSTLEVAPCAGPAAAKLLGVLGERPYSAQVQAEERGSPLALALVALAGALDPHDSSINAEPLKRALREAGALQAAAQVAAEHAAALADPSPTLGTVRHLWRLHKALLVLENACFACPGNEELLLGVSVRCGQPPLLASVGFVQWLVQQVALLARQALIAGIKKDCLRALLAVLMNLTQNNAAGCEAAAAAGAPEAVARVLAQLVRGGPKLAGVAAGGGAELAAWADELSYCLMLLTNLVEHDCGRRQQLRALHLPDARSPAAAAAAVNGVDAPAASAAAPLRLVPLLCALMAAVAPRAASSVAAPGGGGGGGGGGLPRRASLGSGEVSIDCLEHSDAGGHASIAEAYAAILLGFLIQDCPDARAEAASLLGGSLDSAAAAVEGCLSFYVATGAMTKSNEESLRALLASLRLPL